MNADEFLERLWTDVINAVGPALTADWAHVARLARYEAVFEWCNAFDEQGETPAWWLARKKWSTSRWTAAGVAKAPSVRNPKAPFVDAARAWKRLLGEGASPAKLAKHLDAEATAALAGVRALLATFAKRGARAVPEDLFGLHEALLSADPSGHEAGPGSWPAAPKKARAAKAVSAERPKAGPLLRVRRAHQLALSPDGTLVVAASGGKITDVRTGKVVATCGLLANTSSIEWSPDGKVIAATSTSGAVAICDGKTGARKRVLKMDGEGAAPVFSVDGRLLFCGDWDGKLVAWDVQTGRAAATRTLEGTMVLALRRTATGVIALVSHKPSPVELVVLSAALEPVGKGIAAEHAVDIAVDAGGQRVLIANRDTLQWCPLKAGKLGKAQPLENIGNVALSPDGTVVVATVRAGFRVGTTRDLAATTLVERKHPSGRASFSRDGARVAIATEQEGEVWDVATLIAS